MATQHCSRSGTVYPHFSSRPTAALAAVLDNLSDAPLLARLWLYRTNGRPGWPLRSLWRAYVASFVLNLGSTNDLIRLLMRDRQVRRLCGFGDRLPHRTTFNRFISRLACHPDLVEQSIASVTGHLRELLPDLGDEVAVDSTTVRTHANPNRQTLSDPQASWTAKNSTKAKEGGKEWHYGYKLHMAADANHGIPLGMVVTTAKRGDSPELPSVMDQARGWFPWFRPTAVMADRGYDGMSNYQHVQRHGGVPVILIRELSEPSCTMASTPRKACPPVWGRFRWSGSGRTRPVVTTCTAAQDVTWPGRRRGWCCGVTTRCGRTRRPTRGCSAPSGGKVRSGRHCTPSGRPSSERSKALSRAAGWSATALGG